MDAATKSPWSILLDRVAIGILNWRSTARGLLRLAPVVSGYFVMMHRNDPGNAHYERWIFYLAVGAEAIKSILDLDTPGKPIPDSDKQALDGPSQGS